MFTLLRFFSLFSILCGRTCISKSMFLFGLLKVFLAIMSTWDCDSHKPSNLHLFFSFIYLFWTNDAVVLFSLSTFAEQVSNILQFPSVYNFPLHLHTYFLIYTDDKILPNKFVLKSCLILVACNSDFFWLSIWWMTINPIGSLWQPMPLLEKRMLMPVRFIL